MAADSGDVDRRGLKPRKKAALIRGSAGDEIARSGMNEAFRARFPGIVVSFARAFPPASQLPQLPPVPWVDNDGSLGSKLFSTSF
jgi:hypothetical protein